MTVKCWDTSIYSITVSFLLVVKAQAKNNGSAPEGESSAGTEKVAVSTPDITAMRLRRHLESVMMLMCTFPLHLLSLNSKSSSPPQHTHTLKLKESGAKLRIHELWPRSLTARSL